MCGRKKLVLPGVWWSMIPLECCFQQASFLHLNENLHRGPACALAQKNHVSSRESCSSTLQELKEKLGTNTDSLHRRETDGLETDAGDPGEGWAERLSRWHRESLVSLRAVEEYVYWKHQPRPCIPRAVLAAEWRHSMAHKQDAQVRLLESEAIYGRVRTTVARWVWGL